jgi:sialate O-acetylesterase
MTRLLLGGLLSLALGSVHAELFVPAVLSSNMVLPAENATVWGTSTPGTPIRLRLISRGSAPLERSTVADAKGGWAFHLLHLEPSLEPADLTISGDGGNKTLSGVLFGLLVLCSGQSNMEITIDAFEGYSPRPGNNATEIKANSTQYADRIRIMTVARAGRANPGPPDTDVRSAAPYVWGVPSPLTLGGKGAYFSAECWATGTALATLRPRTPIGLLCAAVGGSMIQSWMSPGAMAACPTAKLRHPPAFGSQGQWWNGMVSPLLPLRPSAVVWHQGEENADDGLDYTCLQNSMIADWRRHFATPELPFVFVQLQPCGIPPSMRYAQVSDAPAQLTIAPLN